MIERNSRRVPLNKNSFAIREFKIIDISLVLKKLKVLRSSSWRERGRVELCFQKTENV